MATAAMSLVQNLEPEKAWDSDRSLVERCAGGDTAAWEELVRTAKDERIHLTDDPIVLRLSLALLKPFIDGQR